jgi:hypothetical protein
LLSRTATTFPPASIAVSRNATNVSQPGWRAAEPSPEYSLLLMVASSSLQEHHCESSCPEVGCAIVLGEAEAECYELAHIILRAIAIPTVAGTLLCTLSMAPAPSSGYAVY